MIELSVIIPTRNRADLLDATLESITKQTFPSDKFEIIVIDNGSTDNTAEICKKYQCCFPEFRYFYEPSPGLHVGRHKGAKESRSSILVYADDDIKATSSWLEGIMEAFQDTEIAMVGGNNLPLFIGTPPGWLDSLWKQIEPQANILWQLSLIDLGQEAHYINPFYIFGCNFSIRKETLISAGGFMPDCMPSHLMKYQGNGETHVSNYVAEHGLKAWFTPKATVYHTAPCARMTYHYVGFIRFRQGISDAFVLLRRRGYVKFSNLIKLYLLKLKRIFTPSKSVLDYYCNLRDIDGHIFLYKSALKDKSLMQWICRKDYWDAKVEE